MFPSSGVLSIILQSFYLFNGLFSMFYKCDKYGFIQNFFLSPEDWVIKLVILDSRRSLSFPKERHLVTKITIVS